MEKLLRYPGITPFSKYQQNIFFGRDSDIQNLKNLILVRNQVLLYAKSGVGKTSLLNAGVLPIINEKYTPIQIRFTSYTTESRITPVQNIIDLLSEKIIKKKTILDKLIECTNHSKKLWFCLKQIQLQSMEKPYILVFDQFEELFTYPDKQVDEFKEQLSQIIKTEIPDDIFDLISLKPDLEEHRDIDKLYDEIKVKIVYAIRSDKLSLLNQLSDKISNIQRDFYELKPLTEEQARQAIISPAKEYSQNFITDTFEFEVKAINKIIQALSDKDIENIETTQLQIVCQRIEEIVIDKQINTQEKNTIRITQNDLPEFKDIFFNFYENAVNQTKEIEKTHKFIEDHLIRNEQRISLDERICKDFITETTLKKLTYSHLLRSEPNSTGSFNYELSHDTLIEPILLSRKDRLAKEAKRLAKEIVEKEQAENDRKRRRQLTIIYIVSLAALVSLAFSVFGFINMEKAENALNELKDTQYRSNFEKGKSAAKAKNFVVALENFKVAEEFVNINIENSTDKERAIEIEKAIEFCQNQIKKKPDYVRLINEAENYENEKKWLLSLEKYIEADQLGYGDINKDIINNKKTKILNELKKELEELLNDKMLDNTVSIKRTKDLINNIENLNY